MCNEVGVLVPLILLNGFSLSLFFFLAMQHQVKMQF